jgi:hypothetical protein
MKTPNEPVEVLGWIPGWQPSPELRVAGATAKFPGDPNFAVAPATAPI